MGGVGEPKTAEPPVGAPPYVYLWACLGGTAVAADLAEFVHSCRGGPLNGVRPTVFLRRRLLVLPAYAVPYRECPALAFLRCSAYVPVLPLFLEEVAATQDDVPTQWQCILLILIGRAVCVK